MHGADIHGKVNLRNQKPERNAHMEEKRILHDIINSDHCLYQVSTLQALALGYLRKVVTVEELLTHGNTGLGTFEDLDGEMIALDGHCYRAGSDGNVNEVDVKTGVPFSVVSQLQGARSWDWGEIASSDALVEELNKKIEEHFGLNSMHVVRIDGTFDLIDARSELPSRKSQHVTLKELLSKTQYAFKFENIKGSVICLYFPDYMDGINLPGWHLHFISEDRQKGGHVFNLKMHEGHVRMDKISRIELQLPTEASFDTYALKMMSQKEVESVEQGNG